MKIRLCMTMMVLVAAAASAQIPTIEREALIALYNSTDGAHWSQSTNWIGPVGSECDWFGVYCEEGHVESLGLSANLLSGTIPPELGNFSNLEGLYLDSNQLIGTIPPELHNLSSLKWLYLQHNQLNGSIPPELGNISSLEWLWLNSNQLSGNIPSELQNLPNLTFLVLGSNQLSGSIPPELGNILGLMALMLDTNELSGNIPSELGSLSNLTTLALNFNQLTGNIPPELADLSSLQNLYLHFNHLDGCIPGDLGGIPTLKGLLLHGNQLSGEIPPELGDLSSLVHLHLGSNQLEGSIPTHLGNLSSLEFLDLGLNLLDGSVPAAMGTLVNLVYLNLSSNKLSGGIPPEVGNLTGLETLLLNGNQLSGSIPTEMANLVNLIHQTDISFNALWTDDPVLQSFLAANDPGWDLTQTIAPVGLTVVSVSDQTVWLEWAPITYVSDGGGYDVLFDDLMSGFASGGCTSDKTTTSFPVTELQPDQAYDFTVSTFTLPHTNNQNMVVSEPSESVMTTTSNSGDTTPEVTVTGDSGTFTLVVESGHDSYLWCTGETTLSILVSPSESTHYWVRATGPGDYDEAAVLLIDPGSIFKDGFEDGDTTNWLTVGG